jgi:hypothetical protein
MLPELKNLVYLASFANLKGHVKIDEIEITRMIAIKPKKKLVFKGLINQYYQTNLWRENQYHNTY